MTRAIKYECKQCAITVQLGIFAPPRDENTLADKFQNFFYRCPRCNNEMTRYAPNQYGGWYELPEDFDENNK